MSEEVTSDEGDTGDRDEGDTGDRAEGDVLAEGVSTYGALGGLCCVSSIPALAGWAVVIGLIGAKVFGDRLGLDLSLEQWKVILVVVGLPILLWLGISHWRAEQRRRAT